MSQQCTHVCVIFSCSLLSHSAVVARELGLPTVVGVSGGLMKRLKVGNFCTITNQPKHCFTFNLFFLDWNESAFGCWQGII